MSEDAAFVAAIAAAPLDDLRRLVYADWLDERGRADEAEYLRLVAELASSAEVDVTHPHAVRLLAVADALPPDWREAVGSRFDLWLDWYEQRQKLNFIRCVRQVGGLGLMEAKQFSEALPKVLSGAGRFEEAVELLGVFGGIDLRSRVTPTGASSATGLIPMNVVLRLEMWYLNDALMASAEEVQAALGHVRRILLADSELANLASSVPDTLDGRTNRRVEVVVGTARAMSELADWRRRLHGGRFLLGSSAEPPFSGVITVWLTPR